jgi:hypothetical protein
MPLDSLFGAIDRYSWKARVRPVILALLPIMALTAAAAPALTHSNGEWLLVLLAGAVLLAEPLGRARGKQLENSLFAGWGGKPTVQLLRYSGPMNETQLTYLRTRVQEIVGPLLPLPSEAEEAADPVKADEVYETASAVLRARARALSGAHVLADQDSEYGFRRNALGLRCWAVAICLTALLGMSGMAIWTGVSGESVNGTAFVLWPVLIIGDLGLLAFWFRVVRPTWVEEAAWAYARQLYETVGLTGA